MIAIAIFAAAGVAVWSLAEYALHDWYGHRARGRNDFSREHLHHHADTSYFTPTPKKARVAAMAMAVLSPLSIAALGVPRGAAFAAGFLVAYVGYEVLHRRCHTHPPRGPYGRWARRHHFHHHFGNPKSNHGVTSPLWDRVFGTYEEPGQVRVPERQAMSWLVDDDGDVRADHASDYRIVRKRRATAS